MAISLLKEFGPKKIWIPTTKTNSNKKFDAHGFTTANREERVLQQQNCGFKTNLPLDFGYLSVKFGGGQTWSWVAKHVFPSLN